MPQVLFDALARSTIQGTLLATVVWLVCRFAARAPAHLRCALWWLVGAKMLVAFVCAATLNVPLLPASAVSRPAKSGAREPIVTGAPSVRGGAIGQQPLAPGSFDDSRPVSSAGAALGVLSIVWVLGASVGIGLLFRDGRRARRLRDGARRASPELIEAAEALASALGVARVPDVLVSDAIGTPQVVGARATAILLPARGVERLSVAERRMALCHELVHVRRRDLWFAWVPAIASRLFFFNPIAHAAGREYWLAREAACDAEVMRVLGAAPHAYGRLLLSLGVSPVADLAAAGGSRTFQQLERRLLMLGHATSTTSRRLAWTAMAFVACALLPIRLTARPASQTEHAAGPPAAVVAAVPPGGAPVAVLGQDTGKPVMAAPPERSASDWPVSADAARRYPTQEEIVKHTRDYAWIILSKDGKMHMNGWGEDAALARRQQRGSEPLLWVRRAGEQFVIRDPDLIARASGAFAKVNELGARQAAVGQRQAELGYRMAEVGAKQGAVGAKQSALGAKQAEISARQAALGAEQARRRQAYGDGQEVNRADLEGMQHQASDEMRIYEEQARALAQEMDALRQPMEDLAKQLQPLARQQQDLGAEMETLAAKAEADMRQLIDQAIADGKAERVH
jgi:beta-lactamase regulating signal transducer with metallopeptidase domain